MSLQKYIRQVKPRNESYTPPVEQVQQFFLTEGTDFSTAMESVLGIAYAAAALGGDRGREYLKKEATTGKFKKDFNLTKQVHTNKKVLDIDALMEFGENIKKVVAGDGNFAFQGKGVQTPDWQKWKGRGGKDTSKTDIVLGGKHCSVKNAAGAQLMSGKKGESIATTCAASEASGLDGDVTGDILQSINALQTITTEGYFASVENLKKLQERGGGQRLYDFAKGEVEAYDAALTAWESKEGALKKDKPKKPTKEIYRVYNNKDLADKMPTLIDGVNKQFLDDMDTKFNVAADEVKTKLSDAFKGNNDFKLAFVYEAASGTRKFGDVIQRAQYVLSWERKSNIKDFKINLSNEEMLINTQPTKKDISKINAQIEKEMTLIMETISAIRNIKASLNVPPGKTVDLFVRGPKGQIDVIENNIILLNRIVRVKKLKIGIDIEKPSQAATAIVRKLEIFIPLEELIDPKKEASRLKKQIEDMNGRLNAVKNKLENKNFIDRAPKNIVEHEQKKLMDYESKLKKLNKNLHSLNQ